MVSKVEIEVSVCGVVPETLPIVNLLSANLHPEEFCDEVSGQSFKSRAQQEATCDEDVVGRIPANL